MTDLISRLEAATEGSRELSDECLLAMGWTYKPDWCGHAWRSPDESWVGFDKRPDPTRNVQDAIDWMVPDQVGGNKAGFLHAAMYQQSIGDISDKQIPLVVCAKALRARGQTE